MAVKLYMDHNVPRAISNALRSRGIDIITAYEDGTSELSDSELLDRVTELGRVLFTGDFNLLQEGASRQRLEKFFGGIIYAHQLRVTIGTCVNQLEILAKSGDKKDFVNNVIFLPI